MIPATLLTRSLLVITLLAAASLRASAQEIQPAPTPDALPADAVLWEVTGNDVNLRSGPSIDYHDVGRVARGDLLVGVGADARGEWKRVRVPGGPVVHVFGSLLDWDEGALHARVRSDDVLMRATPAQAYLPVHDQKLEKGEQVVVLGQTDGDDGRWLRVIAPERIHVWIHGRYVNELGSGPDAERIRALAEARLDGLTEGRTKAARLARQDALRAEWTRRVEAVEAALTAQRATASHRDEAARIETDAPFRDLRVRARMVREGVVRSLDRRREEADAAEIARTRREVDEMAREQAEREDRYRRQMEALEQIRRRTGRGEAFDTGVVARQRGVIVLMRGSSVIRELVSRRLRLGDYVGRRVRIWGDHAARDGVLDRVDVTSLEILPNER